MIYNLKSILILIIEKNLKNNFISDFVLNKNLFIFLKIFRKKNFSH